MSTIRYAEENPPRMHIKCRTGDVADYVIMPGDPFRCERIAEFFDEYRLVAHNREHKTYTGTYKGIGVTVTSTGMGCPSASIAAEELISCGAKCLIRLGSGYVLKDEIGNGDLAITTGSAKFEGTTGFFVPDGYPAIADTDLVISLAGAARQVLSDSPYKVHLGISATVDALYGETPEFIDRLKSYGIMNVEMESAAIITAAQVHGVRGACICTCGRDESTPEGEKLHYDSVGFEIRTVLEAIVDFENRKRGGRLIAG